MNSPNELLSKAALNATSGERFTGSNSERSCCGSVLLLMAMIGAIVLARRDVLATDVVTGEVADQGLIEKARTPLLMNRAD